MGRDFSKFWTAQSLSLFGTQVTRLALPLLAATTLHASPVQMGLLASLSQLPYLLFSLPAGVVVDRVRRRWMLVWCDVAAAIALVTIPAAAAFGGPPFWHLCVVTFIVGITLVFSEVANYSYVPSLVGRSHLTGANSRLQVSYSVAESAGPGAGGLLVQFLTAPIAILVDVVSFVASALLVGSIRTEEPSPEPSDESTGLMASLLVGMRLLLRHPLLRPIILTGIVVGLYDGAMLGLYILYCTRELGFSAATIGLIAVVGGVGALPGAAIATRVGSRWGVGWSIVIGLSGAALPVVTLPLLTAGGVGQLVVLCIATGAGALAFTIANIHQWTLRQAVTPDRIAGKVTAAQRFLVYGSGSLGALAGGALGDSLGIRGAVFVCAGCAVLAPLVTVFSPVRTLREQPQGADEGLAEQA